MKQTFTAGDGATLAFQDSGGAGLPVLCLSGLTRNGSDFDYVAPYLSDVRLIRLDYRGRGGSDWTGAASYTIPQEGADALALLDHLRVARAAILGTSRGGLIAMMLAATAKDRLLGVCLNDVGPVIETSGLDVIKGYIGRNPLATSLPDLARARARMLTGFEGVPDARWLEEAEKHYIDTGEGITINYDPELARIFDTPAPAGDAWPLFDAMQGLPLALIRGANSDLLSAETAAEMRRRRPDMAFAGVPGRGHIPFLDEPEALAALRTWIKDMAL